jgi:hypothetical protein
MNEQFWLGLSALPVAAVLIAVSVVILGYANKMWRKLHERLLLRVDPAQTPALRSRQAERIGEALQRGNSIRMVSGLGGVFLWARDSKLIPPAAKTRPADESETA